MVVIASVAFTELMGMVQERSTSPLMWTEQAPHWAMPQPYLVPVNPSCSRSTQSNGILPPTFTSKSLPFTFNLAMPTWPPIWLRTATPTVSAVDTSQLCLPPCSHSRASRSARTPERARRAIAGRGVIERDLLCGQRDCATPMKASADAGDAARARALSGAFLPGPRFASAIPPSRDTPTMRTANSRHAAAQRQPERYWRGEGDCPHGAPAANFHAGRDLGNFPYCGSSVDGTAKLCFPRQERRRGENAPWQPS